VANCHIGELGKNNGKMLAISPPIRMQEAFAILANQWQKAINWQFINASSVAKRWQIYGRF